MSASGLPQPGETIAGRYRIERTIGEGGMGVVLAARQLGLDRQVAIKLLQPDAAGDETAIARFLREARAAASLSSEHVVAILDVGRLESGAPYIAMEYIDGHSLEREVDARGPLPIADAVDYVLQAVEAVAEAHAHGIIHRDLKPANLILTHRSDNSPLVKVVDFGISRAPAADSSREARLTGTGALLGSPNYMSPEQALSPRQVDERSDVWALGAVLYELCAGQPPFSGETLAEVIAAILQREPRPLAACRPEVPAGLAQVVAACLDKDPEARPQSVGALAAALAPFAPARSALHVSRAQQIEAQRRPSPAPPADLAVASTKLAASPSGSLAGAAGDKPSPAIEHGGTVRVLKALAWLVLAGGVAIALVVAGNRLTRSERRGSSDSRAPAASAAATASTPLAAASGPAGELIDRAAEAVAAVRSSRARELPARPSIAHLYFTPSRAELLVLDRDTQLRSYTYYAVSRLVAEAPHSLAIANQHFYELERVDLSLPAKLSRDALARTALAGAHVEYVQLYWRDAGDGLDAGWYWWLLLATNGPGAELYLFEPDGRVVLVLPQ